MSGRKAASEEGISSRRPRKSSFLLTSVICICFQSLFHQKKTSKQTPPRDSCPSQTGTSLPESFTRFCLKGPPLIDLFASCRSAQTRRFFAWNAANKPEAIDALSQKWDFSLAYLFSPIPLLKRVIRKLESSWGTYLLVTQFWDAQTWFASPSAGSGGRLPMSADLIINLTTGEPPPNLNRLFLVVWTISGGVGESIPSQIGHSISPRQDGSDP
jgi:hypothetical protein